MLSASGSPPGSVSYFCVYSGEQVKTLLTFCKNTFNLSVIYFSNLMPLKWIYFGLTLKDLSSVGMG